MPHPRSSLLTGLILNRAQHERLAALCTADASFPSWTQWNKLQIRATAAAQSRGDVVESWSLDLEDFLEWCRLSAVTPCLTGLRAYVHARRIAAMQPLPGYVPAAQFTAGQPSP